MCTASFSSVCSDGQAPPSGDDLHGMPLSIIQGRTFEPENVVNTNHELFMSRARSVSHLDLGLRPTLLDSLL